MKRRPLYFVIKAVPADLNRFPVLLDWQAKFPLSAHHLIHNMMHQLVCFGYIGRFTHDLFLGLDK